MPLDTTPFPVTIPGETRVPTGCVVVATYDQSIIGDLVAGNPSYELSFGVTDFVTQAVISASDKDNAAVTDTISHHRETAIVYITTPGGNTIERTATVAAIAGGVTVTPGEAGEQFNLQVHLLFDAPCFAFSTDGGGTVLSDASIDIAHNLGIAPGCGFYGSTHIYQGVLSVAQISIGVHGTEGGVTQRCMAQRSLNGQAFTTIRGHITSQRVSMIMQNNGLKRSGYELTTNGVNTNVYTNRDGDAINTGFIGLLVNLGVTRASTIMMDIPINAAVDWSESSLPFFPQYVFNIGSSAEVEDIAIQTSDAGQMGIIAMGENQQHSSMLVASELNAAPSNSFSLRTFGIHGTDADGVIVLAAFDHVFQTGGFLIPAADLSVMPSVLRKWPSLFIEASNAITLPILTIPVISDVGASQATATTDTDVISGFFWGVVTQSAVAPTAQQVFEGWDENGDPADSAATITVDALGGPPTPMVFTGLIDGTTYFAHVMQETLGEVFSAVVTSLSFGTSATNQNPVIVGPIPDQTVLIGQAYSFDISPYFADPDGDPLTYTGINIPNGLALNLFSGIISGVPVDNGGGGNPDPKITSVTFNHPGLLNTAPGNAVSAPESDNFPITYAADGHQYTSYGDGRGFGNLPGNLLTRGSFGFARIEGDSNNYSAFDIFKSGESMPGEQGKCYGMLGANGKIYAAVDYYLVGGNGSREDRYHGLSMISNTLAGANAGNSWTEEIRWDAGDWGGNQLDGFYSMAFVQYGQDHGGTRSPLTDPLYVYAILMEHDNDIYEVQNPGGITMIRCLEADLESGLKADWEYLSAIDGSNIPSWSTVITDRLIIFQDSSVDGGNDSSSMNYNVALGRYVLTVMQNSRDTSAPCIMGIYDAPEPWGPWNRVIKENVLTLNIADGNACIFWGFSNKWTSTDGLTNVMVGTLKGQDEWGTIPVTFTFG